MCAPCKVIINEESKDAARRGELLRELTLNPPVNQPEDEDFLFDLAEREAEYIISTRRAAIAFAKKIKAAPRWVHLMERLAGEGYDDEFLPDSPTAI